MERKSEIFLRSIFNKVYQFAKSMAGSAVPKLSLFVGCDLIQKDRRSSKRAFCHVGHRPIKVCTSPHLANIEINFVVGIYLHEIGHCIAAKVWGRSREQDADLAVLEFFGVNLRYKSDLTLEWAPDEVVREVLRVPRKITRRSKIRTAYSHR